MLFLASLCKRSSLAFLYISTVRLLSIVACLLGFAAEIFVLVSSFRGVQSNHDHRDAIADGALNSTVLAAQDSKTTCGYIGSTGVPNEFGGILFFALSQLTGILILILCFLSEILLPVFSRFFDTYFPPLGSNFGVGFIGTLEVFASCNLLSRSLGLFSIVAGWWLWVVGLLNIFLGIICGKEIRHRRNILQAGKGFANHVTHLDDIEKAVKTGKNTLEFGKKLGGKMFTISAPMPPPPTFNPAMKPVSVFEGPTRVS